MRRFVFVLAILALAIAGMPAGGGSAHTAGSSSLAARKQCHYVTKKVHGKKQRVKVCKAARPAPTATPTAQSELTTGAQIDAYLTAHHFSGYMVLSRHGQDFLSKGYGMADAQSGTPNTMQTKYPMFGVTRLFVAVAIMKLQEEGKLSVHDKLCSYVSDCPAQWQPVTLEEMLTDTSGFTDMDPFCCVAGPDTVNDLLLFCRRVVFSNPGKPSKGPSDCNTMLLSSILEKVSGQPWATVMQDIIFGPAGMTNSGRITNDMVPPQRARGYDKGSSAFEVDYNGEYFAYSTVEDLMRFDRALLGGKIISNSSLDALFTPRVQDTLSSPIWRGYQTYVLKADGFPDFSSTAAPGAILPMSTNRVIFQSDGGDGFGVDNLFSPDDDAMLVGVNNDTAYTDDDHGQFLNLTAKLLWRR